MKKDFAEYIKESRADHYTEKEKEILLHNGYHLYNEMEAHKDDKAMHSTIMKICLIGEVNTTFYQYNVFKRDKGISKSYGSGSENDVLSAINKAQKNIDKQEIFPRSSKKLDYLDRAISKNVEDTYFGLPDENERNNVKKFDEFVNEGFYDLMQHHYNPNDNNDPMNPLIMVGFVMGLLSQLLHAFNIQHIIVFMIGIGMNAPSIAVFLRACLRGFYNQIRAKKLLKKTDAEFKKVKDLVNKYPDIEIEVNRIKEDMIHRIGINDRDGVSKCIHDVYELSKNLKDREKLGNFYDMTEEEKQVIRKKIEEKKNELKKKKEAIKNIDPYGEEKWEDGDDKSQWWLSKK